MNKRKNGWTDEQTDVRANRQTDRKTYIQTDEWTDKRTNEFCFFVKPSIDWSQLDDCSFSHFLRQNTSLLSLLFSSHHSPPFSCQHQVHPNLGPAPFAQQLQSSDTPSASVRLGEPPFYSCCKRWVHSTCSRFPEPALRSIFSRGDVDG